MKGINVKSSRRLKAETDHRTDKGTLNVERLDLSDQGKSLVSIAK